MRSKISCFPLFRSKAGGASVGNPRVGFVGHTLFGLAVVAASAVVLDLATVMALREVIIFPTLLSKGMRLGFVILGLGLLQSLGAVDYMGRLFIYLSCLALWN
jgi:hypothetical protein